MKLPFLLSVPHAGTEIPQELKHLCRLSSQDIIKDSDEGAAEIYPPLKKDVFAFAEALVARAFIDMNRAENDRSKDGVVKTHTCWNIPIYKAYPSKELIESLLSEYYRPYHKKLSLFARGSKLGIDCHTMAIKGPPIGPDPGICRPHICVSNAGFTCPPGWILSLAECLEKAFGQRVAINHPFKGGFIIREHAKELPWIQLEISRASCLNNKEKRYLLLSALEAWYEKH